MALVEQSVTLACWNRALSPAKWSSLLAEAKRTDQSLGRTTTSASTSTSVTADETRDDDRSLPDTLLSLIFAASPPPPLLLAYLRQGLAPSSTHTPLIDPASFLLSFLDHLCRTTAVPVAGGLDGAAGVEAEVEVGAKAETEGGMEGWRLENARPSASPLPCPDLDTVEALSTLALAHLDPEDLQERAGPRSPSSILGACALIRLACLPVPSSSAHHLPATPPLRPPHSRANTNTSATIGLALLLLSACAPSFSTSGPQVPDSATAEKVRQVLETIVRDLGSVGKTQTSADEASDDGEEAEATRRQFIMFFETILAWHPTADDARAAADWEKAQRNGQATAAMTTMMATTANGTGTGAARADARFTAGPSLWRDAASVKTDYLNATAGPEVVIALGRLVGSSASVGGMQGCIDVLKSLLDVRLSRNGVERPISSDAARDFFVPFLFELFLAAIEMLASAVERRRSADSRGAAEVEMCFDFVCGLLPVVLPSVLGSLAASQDVMAEDGEGTLSPLPVAPFVQEAIWLLFTNRPAVLDRCDAGRANEDGKEKAKVDEPLDPMDLMDPMDGIFDTAYGEDQDQRRINFLPPPIRSSLLSSFTAVSLLSVDAANTLLPGWSEALEGRPNAKAAAQAEGLAIDTYIDNALNAASSVEETAVTLSRLLDDAQKSVSQPIFAELLARRLSIAASGGDIDTLARFWKELADNRRFLDVAFLYVAPVKWIEPVTQFVDAYVVGDEDDASYLFPMFGTVVLSLQVIFQRHGLSSNLQAHLGAVSDGFFARFLRSSSAALGSQSLSEEEKGLLGRWISALFDSEGISDDLVRSTPPQSLLFLTPTLFSQSTAACSLGVIDLDTLRSGLTYFLQGVLNFALPGALRWLAQEIRRLGPTSPQTCIHLDVLHTLVTSESFPLPVIPLVFADLAHVLAQAPADKSEVRISTEIRAKVQEMAERTSWSDSRTPHPGIEAIRDVFRYASSVSPMPSPSSALDDAALQSALANPIKSMSVLLDEVLSVAQIGDLLAFSANGGGQAEEESAAGPERRAKKALAACLVLVKPATGLASPVPPLLRAFVLRTVPDRLLSLSERSPKPDDAIGLTSGGADATEAHRRGRPQPATLSNTAMTTIRTLADVLVASFDLATHLVEGQTRGGGHDREEEEEEVVERDDEDDGTDDRTGPAAARQRARAGLAELGRSFAYALARTAAAEGGGEGRGGGGGQRGSGRDGGAAVALGKMVSGHAVDVPALRPVARLFGTVSFDGRRL